MHIDLSFWSAAHGSHGPLGWADFATDASGRKAFIPTESDPNAASSPSSPHPSGHSSTATGPGVWPSSCRAFAGDASGRTASTTHEKPVVEIEPHPSSVCNSCDFDPPSSSASSSIEVDPVDQASRDAAHLEALHHSALDAIERFLDAQDSNEHSACDDLELATRTAEDAIAFAHLRGMSGQTLIDLQATYQWVLGLSASTRGTPPDEPTSNRPLNPDANDLDRFDITPSIHRPLNPEANDFDLLKPRFFLSLILLAPPVAQTIRSSCRAATTLTSRRTSQ